MTFWLTLRVAIRALRRNKLRSALTMLGVIIGVAAVITVVALAGGADRLVQKEIASLGTEMILVFPGSHTRGGAHGGMGSRPTLTEDDARAIARECPAVRAAAGTMRGGQQIVYENANWQTQVVGSTDAYPEIRQWKVAAGRFFTAGEVETMAKVCVLGQTVVDQLFGDRDPLGATIRVGKVPCRVIGVLAVKGSSPMGQDQDDTVVMPLATFKRRVQSNPSPYVHAVIAAATAAQTVPAAVQQIGDLLRQRHKLGPTDEDDFSVRAIQEFASTARETTRVMAILLASVAAVSLLVGGIGIMNIMLVSVTERTREIGIRLAIGARARDVLWQFLVEAVVLSGVGGLLGMALGVGVTRVLQRFQWPTALGPGLFLLAFSFAVGVGVFFGFYPARRAARLDPIDALRYE